MGIEEQLALLNEYVSEHKQQLFKKVVTDRTKKITVVLENIYQSHNASAVLRTCDLLGVQDVHIIEDRNPFQPSKNVTQGAAKWLNLKRYSEQGATSTCTENLKAQGYVLACANPHANTELGQIPTDRPIAICFGTELQGATSKLQSACEVNFRIPMFGFTESYNISVSAAIVLYYVMDHLRSTGRDIGMTEEEKLQTLLMWSTRSVKDAEQILERAR